MNEPSSEQLKFSPSSGREFRSHVEHPVSTASGGKHLREPSNSCVRVAGQAKIPPLDPLTRPRHGGWGLRKEIDTDRRVRPCRETSTKSASAHTHAIRELHDTVNDRPRINAHPLILASSEPTTARS